MAKRELPIFVLDTNRAHKKGECDWIVCTDRDNGFVAKIDYVDGDIDEVGDDYRIQSRGVGISIRIAIVRSIGDNPKTTDVRTLLKKAAKHYIDTTVKPMNVAQPTRQECVEFLKLLIHSNLHNLDEAGSDYNERNTVLTSLSMLQAAADYLTDDGHGGLS